MAVCEIKLITLSYHTYIDRTGATESYSDLGDLFVREFHSPFNFRNEKNRVKLILCQFDAYILLFFREVINSKLALCESIDFKLNNDKMFEMHYNDHMCKNSDILLQLLLLRRI